MGRGKGDQPPRQIGTMKLADGVWDHLKQIGGGNKTRGFEIVYGQYLEHCNSTNESKQMLTERIRRHIHAPENAALREKYFVFIDEWFKDQSKIWNAPMLYTLFGMTKTNGANVKRSLKQLVHTGFIDHSIYGFRPNIQGNGGWSPEKFEIQIAQYIEMCESMV